MPTLDPARIAELLALGGRSFVDEMLALVRTYVPERLAELEQAVAGGDAVLARKAAHAIKSSAANVGATDVHAAAADAERAARAERHDELAALLPVLQAALAAFAEATRPRVALVEDNPDTRLLVRRILERSGHRLIEYVCARDALAAIFDDPPQVVLLDLTLPDADGDEVVEALRRDPRTAALPVVAFTAHDAAADAAWREARGYDGYLAKPIEAFDAFVDAINRLLPPRSS